MIKRYLNFINERLGVPSGNIESANNVFKELTEFLKKRGNSLIMSEKLTDDTIYDEKSINFKLKSDIKIGDLSYKNIIFIISIIGQLSDYSESNVEVAGMSVFIEPSGEKETYIEYDKLNPNTKIGISLRLAISKDCTFNDVYNMLESEDKTYIGILSHEIKHIYDRVMIGKNMFSEIASYNTWSNVRMGVPAIDSFLYKLYLISKAEGLVRSSEVAGELIASDITKSEFKDFLKSTSIYNKLVELKNFSFENLKSELLEQVNFIKEALDYNDIEHPDNPEELVDFMLDLTYRNIVGNKMEILSSLLRISPLAIAIGMINQEEKEYYNKYLSKIKFENYEKYFEYCEKLIKFESNKVLKKISKLYDMCKDDNVNKLHSKISDRADKSIINPKLHDEFVATKTIKSFESYFPKKDKKR
jgi:hypothetical protein